MAIVPSTGPTPCDDTSQSGSDCDPSPRRECGSGVKSEDRHGCEVTLSPHDKSVVASSDGKKTTYADGSDDRPLHLRLKDVVFGHSILVKDQDDRVLAVVPEDGDYTKDHLFGIFDGIVRLKKYFFPSRLSKSDIRDRTTGFPLIVECDEDGNYIVRRLLRPNCVLKTDGDGKITCYNPPSVDNPEIVTPEERPYIKYANPAEILNLSNQTATISGNLTIAAKPANATHVMLNIYTQVVSPYTGASSYIVTDFGGIAGPRQNAKDQDRGYSGNNYHFNDMGILVPIGAGDAISYNATFTKGHSSCYFNLKVSQHWFLIDPTV